MWGLIAGGVLLLVLLVTGGILLANAGNGSAPQAGGGTSSSQESPVSDPSSERGSEQYTVPEAPSPPELPSEEQFEAGDCLFGVGEWSDPTLLKTSCGSDAADFIVGKILDDPAASCGKPYDFATGDAFGHGKGCLVPIFEEGQCYKLKPTRAGYDIQLCRKGGESVVKVVTVIKGSTDAGKCPEPDASLVYPKPKRTYCLGPPR